jgi:hypothetical protein
LVCGNPRAWPDVRDPGSVEEIREAFGSRCWVPYMPHAGTFGFCRQLTRVAARLKTLPGGWTCG